MRQAGSYGFELQKPYKKLKQSRTLDEWIPVLQGDPTPPRQRPLSPTEETLLADQVAKWLVQGVVEVRRHRHVQNNNIVFAAKKNGSVRVCNDCTPANAVTSDLEWPLPRLQDLRHKINGSSYFSRIDLKDAFFRIKVPNKFRYLTAFTSRGVQYQFCRMPFGVKTGPATFQRFMDQSLAKLLLWLVIYIDDLLVHAPTLFLLRQRTRQLKAALKQAGCMINEEKSEYEKKELIFAGIHVSSEGTGPNVDQVARVLAIPLPSTKADMASALGLVSYLREFIPLVSHFTADLHLRKGEEAGTAANDNWQNLLKHIASAISSLRHWDESKDADLFVDASNKATGAVIVQDGRLVAVASRKLTPPQTRYSATDREHLALVDAAKWFRVFLHRPSGVTRVHSDHAALVGKRSPDMTPRQYRWQLLINQWMPHVRHVPGKKNPADFFSRWGLEINGGVVKT